MQADGANRTCFADVSSPTWSVPSVVWSPDSSQIAFDAGGVHILKSDGSGLSNLTIREGGHGPAWSPDGRRIAFATDRDGNREIYVMQADGSGQTNLTNRPYYDDSPVWSPDGKEFAFDSSRDGHREICFIGVEGGNLRCHSAESRIGSNVKVWSPTGPFHRSRNPARALRDGLPGHRPCYPRRPWGIQRQSYLVSRRPAHPFLF